MAVDTSRICWQWIPAGHAGSGYQQDIVSCYRIGYIAGMFGSIYFIGNKIFANSL